jgi:alpha-L-fucosidase
MKISRREVIQMLAGALPAAFLSSCGRSQQQTKKAIVQKPNTPAQVPAPKIKIPPAPTHIPAPPGFGIAKGPFEPMWESLSSYRVPDWFRDAKFGIWAHWGPQCQPEMGDWYAKQMYQEGNPIYKFHCKKYGHPSKFGFKDVINEWKAENWDPKSLIEFYKKAGIRYFGALANHHDNFDLWDSTYQPWNSVAIGPKKNIIAGWEKAVHDAGLRFMISVHGDRAWDWYQDAQGWDKTGEFAGIPYDGLLTKADGKGKWWEGLDPQDLYAQYHRKGNYNWALQGQPLLGKAYIEKFFNRTIDLIGKYNPDLLYFDDAILPIYPTSDIGLKIAAYFYNTNLARNGKLEAVLTGKILKPEHRKAILYDVERGVTEDAEALPWQTDTCIGSWHYDRRVYNRRAYKTPKQVVQMLIDIVSKNGNLMLSVPVRGDGTIDELEVKVVEGIGQWLSVNGEGIYASRPWKVYGEGPTTINKTGKGATSDVKRYTAEDIRFTTKGDILYAFAMAWPENGKTVIKSLAKGSENMPGEIGKIEMLGADGPLTFDRDDQGLTVNLPQTKPNEFAYTLKISPKQEKA